MEIVHLLEVATNEEERNNSNNGSHCIKLKPTNMIPDLQSANIDKRIDVLDILRKANGTMRKKENGYH
jgi:hypothetical protein